MLWGVQWYYWLILLAAIILAVFAWSKALKSSRERRERLKKEAAIWKRDYDLRQNYSVLTEEKIKAAHETELLHGVAMNIQVKIENEPDMTEVFNALSIEKKYIYTLEYFDEDAKKGLSAFFKNNGEPLLSLLPDALNAVGAGKYIEYIAELLPMYDENSDISVDYAIIDKADAEFAEKYDSNEFVRLCAAYILKNKEIFLS